MYWVKGLQKACERFLAITIFQKRPNPFIVGSIASINVQNIINLGMFMDHFFALTNVKDPVMNADNNHAKEFAETASNVRHAKLLSRKNLTVAARCTFRVISL